MDTFRFYQHLDRRNPGSVVFTSSYLTPLPLDRRSVIADLGCGYGARAAWVARSRCCEMHVFDTSTQSLDCTFARAEEGGSESQMVLHHVPDATYEQLGVQPHSYDLMMAEGVGFDTDPFSKLEAWRPLVKPGGAIAIVTPGLTSVQANSDVAAPLNERRGAPLRTLADYHEQIASLEGMKLIHQVSLAQYSWDEHYQNLGRAIRALLKNGEASEGDPGIVSARAELDWYRSQARGYLFLQAFVLGVE